MDDKIHSKILDFGKHVKEIKKKKKNPNVDKSIKIGNNSNVFANNGDVYQNTRVTKKVVIQKEPDDISEEQAAEIKKIVDDIVKYETSVTDKIIRQCYWNTWTALNRRMKVTSYHKIKKFQFEKAKKYLISYKGRLKRQFKPVSSEQFKRDRYTAIYTAAKNNHGLTETEIKDYLYEHYQVKSLKDLSLDDLEKVYLYFIR